MLTVVAVLAVVVGFVGCSPKTQSSISFGSDSSFLTGNVPAVAAGACTDSDGGRNYNVKGQTIGFNTVGITISPWDSCRTNRELIEYHCGTAGKVFSKGYTCPYGCDVIYGQTTGDTINNGRCKPAPTPVCGNNVKEGTEQCDTGASNGIVCSPAYGSTCSYCSSSCTTVTVNGARCGDNAINGPEECDDGNVNNNDGCSSTCLTEPASPCVDTDGGNVPSVQGHTWGYNSSNQFVNESDWCRTNTLLVEYICSGGYVQQSGGVCISTCTGGTC
ncbi:hypothetical protein HYS47_03390 [Candidatus Woesearchaeota archaeon]|nr:hypothetical protein [Candidatus Woesearchaeota archaeon]